MATKKEKTAIDRGAVLEEFYNAPETALFSQQTISVIRQCSTAKLERDRWLGGGIPFIKFGRAVRYRKSDVLAWLSDYEPQSSTSKWGV